MEIFINLLKIVFLIVTTCFCVTVGIGIGLPIASGLADIIDEKIADVIDKRKDR